MRLRTTHEAHGAQIWDLGAPGSVSQVALRGTPQDRVALTARVTHDARRGSRVTSRLTQARNDRDGVQEYGVTRVTKHEGRASVSGNGSMGQWGQTH